MKKNVQSGDEIVALAGLVSTTARTAENMKGIALPVLTPQNGYSFSNN